MSDVKQTWTTAAVREAFLAYFEEQQHSRQPSSPLVPGNDPTLLFTNAGMVQFKDVFLGLDERPYRRAATSQKCMRVSGKHNDLENVGPSSRHHTFFEMLGNFSFGNYFKREACAFAYQLVTQVYGLPLERLFFTVHRDDDEAYRIWTDVLGIPAERVAKLGDSTNFWQMADTGPCGYTAEIHYDMKPDGGVPPMDELEVHLDENPDDRTLEIWNLVFMQFNQKADGSREPLPKTGIDTGMGLERITMVLQGVTNTYETDLFQKVFDQIQAVAGHSDTQRAGYTVPYRVVADHTRAAAFMIADGVTPGNEGRNYVCRMIIRRSARFGAKMGLNAPFMAKVAEAVLREYSGQYPELERNRAAIMQTLQDEEERFARTVDVGVANLQHYVEALTAAGRTALDGEKAFELYATYGLPMEITRDILQESKLDVDEAGFRAAMDAHRVASGAGKAIGEMGGEEAERLKALLDTLRASGRLGPDGVAQHIYGALELESEVVALLVDGESSDNATEGQAVTVVLAATPFYTASGGQVADSGSIARFDETRANPVWEVAVSEATKPLGGLILHHGHVARGTVHLGDRAWAMVEDQRRWDIMRNHTATHLLHAELRSVLGDHARQAGSLVAPDRLRFDFNQNSAIANEALREIEERVNRDILMNYPVKIKEMGREEAIEAGATALFGEKYGDTVRTVRIGEPNAFSFELCGGTHVPETADIGPFVIVSEGSVAAGIRRVEALTGRGAQAHLQQQAQTLANVASLLNVPVSEVEGRLATLIENEKAAQKEIARLQTAQAKAGFEGLLAQVADVAGVPVLAAKVDAPDRETLRSMTDWYREKQGSGVAVLASVLAPNDVALIAVVTKDLVPRGVKAGDLLRAVATAMGGKGGGKPEMAQGGGKDASKVDAALAQVVPLVRAALGR